MKEIKCPHDLNQFLLSDPLFKNTFTDDVCEVKKFHGDCYHCFASAMARRDHQLKYGTINKIKAIVAEWKADTWTDNLSYECMRKIADLLAESEE